MPPSIWYWRYRAWSGLIRTRADVSRSGPTTETAANMPTPNWVNGVGLSR
ncbi:hypothetical protein ACFQWF_04330 [Methylorubrum suomiense]